MHTTANFEKLETHIFSKKKNFFSQINKFFVVSAIWPADLLEVKLNDKNMALLPNYKRKVEVISWYETPIPE